MDEFWEAGLILRTLSGSRAHGLAREGSDTDTRGVCIPPARFLVGLSQFEQHESPGRDHVTYALAKFVRLALQGNPNILESLFVDESDVLHVDDAGRRLLAHRRLFLSKLVGKRFAGFAKAQLERMRRHHAWLVDPPSHQPRPEEFGATETAGRQRFPDADRRKAYDAALGHWRNYRTWREERNPDRAALEQRHGYDTKHAMHLVRLLTMGIEVLSLGDVIVKRPDADRLLAIRDGALGYDALLEEVAALGGALDAAEANSSLPPEPNFEAAEELVIELHLESLRGSG